MLKWAYPPLMYTYNASKFLRCADSMNVTVTSYEVQWYSFWYQWIEEVHTYTLAANIGVLGFQYRKSRKGVATTPPPPLRRTCYKNASGRRGLTVCTV